MIKVLIMIILRLIGVFIGAAVLVLAGIPPNIVWHAMWLAVGLSIMTVYLYKRIQK